jgi:hypothetical protein
MTGAFMRRVTLTLTMLACAAGLVSVAPTASDAQTAIQRRAERPLVPRSHGRRQADRAAQQVYVPGHWAFDRRRGQYSWVAGRWERYDPTHAFVGAGWHFRNGQWTFGPMR